MSTNNQNRELQFGFNGKLVPTADHPDDILRCVDNGEERRRADCFFAYDGSPHSSQESADETNEALFEERCEVVKECLEGIEKWAEEYSQSSDCGANYTYLIWEGQHGRDAVGKWVRDNYRKMPKTIMKGIIDDASQLEPNMVCQSQYCRSPGDCPLDTFPIGEIEEQIDIESHDALREAHERGELKAILERLSRDFCLRDWERDNDYFYLYTSSDDAWFYWLNDENLAEIVTRNIIAYCERTDRKR